MEEVAPCYLRAILRSAVSTERGSLASGSLERTRYSRSARLTRNAGEVIGALPVTWTLIVDANLMSASVDQNQIVRRARIVLSLLIHRCFFTRLRRWGRWVRARPPVRIKHEFLSCDGMGARRAHTIAPIIRPELLATPL